jgi:LemA protein
MAQKRTGILIGIIIVVALVLIFSAWFIGTRNKLIAMEERIESAWAEIDNQLKRRSDLIPNLVNTVQGYADHEEEVFTQIAEARSKLAGAGSVEETAQSYGQLNSALSRLLVVVERYPQLKANEQFTRLMDELAGTENRIAVARKRYNDAVEQFNTTIRQYPAVIVAGSLGMEKKPYFEIPEEDREVPEVEFE